MRIQNKISLIALVIAAIGFSTNTIAASSTEKLTSQEPITFPCLNAPTVSSTTPGDTPITSQNGVNCFAWQTFIGLNWQVDATNPGQPDNSITSSEFGEPGVSQTTVWETYANIKDVMRADAKPPLPWGTPSISVDACTSAISAAGDKGNVRIMTSSRTNGDFNLSEDAKQAFPTNNPNWLADKNGNVVYYEILIGKDQYDYINDNRLYNLNQQVAHLEANKNIVMPQGYDTKEGKAVQGGLEIKAAWLQVSDPSNDKWKRFKTTAAYIHNDTTNDCKKSTMALVGLHIIHKTASQPQWIWATFEHVDNAPNNSDIGIDGEVSGDYTFYSNSCSVQDVHSDCEPKKIDGSPVTTTSCEVNTSPAYYLTGAANCPPYPIQVSRVFEIKDTTANKVATLNASVKAMITDANADSVFANYELVNVLWSSAAVNDNEPPGNPPVIPLSISGATPSQSTVPVANTMLETYAQGMNCLACHKDASISSRAGASKKYATDYSFVFSFANKPPSTPTSKK